MSTALVVELAEIIKTKLNGHEFSKHFVAIRTALPEINEDEMKDTLYVLVVPRTKASEIEARAIIGNTISVDVAVLNHVADTTNTTIDPLLALVQEIEEFMELDDNRHLPMPLGGAEAWWTQSANAPIYDPKRLRESRVFFSLLTLTYEAHR